MMKSDIITMDYSLSLPTITLISLTLFFLYNIWRIITKKPSIHQKESNIIKQPPQPFVALPLIGHLHLLGTKTPLHRTFASLADKYGPVFQIYFGSLPAIVISNKEGIKECFTKNDKVLASRTPSSRGTHLAYNNAAFGFAPYGPYWAKQRKLAVLELLSSRRLESLRHVYESEIDTLIKDLLIHLSNNNSSMVVMSEWFERLTFNVITKIVAGKRYFSYLEDVDDLEAHKVVNLVKEFMQLAGGFVLSDAIPLLRWIGVEGRVLKSMKRIGRDLDTLIGRWVEEHKMKGNMVNSSSEKQDFIDVMLSIVEDDPESGHSRDTIIKAHVMNLILAGTETTSTTMTWILAALMNNKHSLKLAQEEINHHVGKDRKVEASDIKNLTYLQAIFKETLRLYPPTPLLLPHGASSDCSINGYYVPKGADVFLNVWKLHRDPSIWSEPEKFSPERFINGDGEVDEGHHFEYLPFGLGRRACPGFTLATQVILITVARLLQGFDFHLFMDEPVDMREGFGLTLLKLNPLQICLTPLVTTELYQ
ncbi:cytochrome P450 CYP82J17 [Arachis hypogaea]|nr:cytochrome P450 CYP82D47 [Arachis hypogaea]